jgi:hypothetical protein
MKYIHFICFVLFSISSLAQFKSEKDIVIEAKKLYRSEMASWNGTDIFLAKFQDKLEKIGGYFSYELNERSNCVFFSNDSLPKILGTFSFDSTFNLKTVIIDNEERLPTSREANLISIRKSAFKTMTTDTLFKFYKDTDPNLIPLDDENGKRVYILTGPKKQGVVIFGNDYLLKFDNKGKLSDKKRLHKSLLQFEYGNKDGKIVTGAMHTHLPGMGELITATDICTLMLYAKFAQWERHIVISETKVSIWNCKTDRLIVMDKRAWEKIYKDK